MLNRTTKQTHLRRVCIVLAVMMACGGSAAAQDVMTIEGNKVTIDGSLSATGEVREQGVDLLGELRALQNKMEALQNKVEAIQKKVEALPMMDMWSIGVFSAPEGVTAHPSTSVFLLRHGDNIHVEGMLVIKCPDASADRAINWEVNKAFKQLFSAKVKYSNDHLPGTYTALTIEGSTWHWVVGGCMRAARIHMNFDYIAGPLGN